MDFYTVFARVFFLVSIALIGWVLGRRLPINPRDISLLLVYLISPAVIFVAIIQAPSGRNYMAYAAGAFLFCIVLATLAYAIGRRIWSDGTANLFGFAGGTGNTGYFGLPLAIGLFDEAGAALAAFIILGVNLYEFTYGYYLSARSAYSFQESLRRIVRLPLIYAFLVGLVVRSVGWFPGDVLLAGLNNFKGAYSVLGMLVIGMTLGRINRLEIDRLFLLSALAWKFMVWPAAAMLLVVLIGDYVDHTTTGIILLMACVPMAGNTVVIASELGVHPEKAATAVMASTLLAAGVVPLALALFAS